MKDLKQIYKEYCYIMEELNLNYIPYNSFYITYISTTNNLIKKNKYKNEWFLSLYYDAFSLIIKNKIVYTKTPMIYLYWEEPFNKNDLKYIEENKI